MDDVVLTVSVSEFKSKCLALFDALEERKLSLVVVTRHGRPVAELTPPQGALPSLWGCMRGTVTIPPDVDLTEPVLADPLPVGSFRRARGGPRPAAPSDGVRCRRAVPIA